MAAAIPVAAPTLAGYEQSNGGVIKEVVVTAQRMKKPEQWLPVSVMTYSGAKKVREGIQDMQALAAVEPSLQFNRNVGWADLMIRGLLNWGLLRFRTVLSRRYTGRAVAAGYFTGDLYDDYIRAN